MPGKPSRRDRRRRGASTERRPRPAPPVAPGRIVRAARTEAFTTRPETETDVEPDVIEETQATAEALRPTRARAGATGTLRRGATTSARAMEAQREERIRRDSIKDLRTIAVAATVTLVGLITAAIVF